MRSTLIVGLSSDLQAQGLRDRLRQGLLRDETEARQHGGEGLARTGVHETGADQEFLRDRAFRREQTLQIKLNGRGGGVCGNVRRHEAGSTLTETAPSAEGRAEATARPQTLNAVS